MDLWYYKGVNLKRATKEISMKERAYPVYTVNKHAEGLLVGGHPWVYEKRHPPRPGHRTRKRTLADVVSPKGAYLGTGFVSLQQQRSGCGSSAATPTTPLTPLSGAAGWSTPGPNRKTVLEPRRPDRLPGDLWRGRPVPRPDRGPLPGYPGHPDPQRGHGKAQAGAVPPAGRGAAGRRPDHCRHLRAQRRGPARQGRAGAEQGLVRPARRDAPRQHPD